MQLNPHLSGFVWKMCILIISPEKMVIWKRYTTNVSFHLQFPGLAISMPRVIPRTNINHHFNSEVGLAAPGRQPVPLISLFF